MKIPPFFAGWWSLLRQHWRIAVPGFAVGMLVWVAVGMLWPKHYTASALLAQNPHAGGLENLTFDGEVRQAAALEDWQGIVTRFHLYPQLVANGGLPRAAALLGSQVSIREIAAPELGGAAVRLQYSGSNADLVREVMEMVAAGFLKPLTPKPHASDNDPLYVPVVLPSIEPLAMTPAPAPKGARQSEAAEALTRRIQASMTLGTQLQMAYDQNEASLIQLRSDLRDEQKKTQPVAAAKTFTQPATTANPREERLRAELTKAERDLAALQDRYTDEYPDVVAASEKVHDLKLDLSRIAAASPAPVVRVQEPKPMPESPAHLELISSINRQIQAAEAAQSRLTEAIRRNREETARLQASLATLSRSKPLAATLPAPQVAQESADASSNSTLADSSFNAQTPVAVSSAAAPSPFFLVQPARVVMSPAIFAPQLLWSLGLVFGIFSGLLAAWLAERRDPSIRNETMLRNELPASAVYLGGVPRIRHEVIAD